jgi:HSP20 family protein
MMLTRYNPFQELDRLRWHAWEAQSLRPSAVPVDAYRHGDSFVVTLDLPGVDPKTIDLSVKKDTLTIKAERSWQRAEGDEVLMAERSQGTFARQFFLGELIDRDRIDASYDYGVLTVKLAVAEEAKARKIEITSGAQPKIVEVESRVA